MQWHHPLRKRERDQFSGFYSISAKKYHPWCSLCTFSQFETFIFSGLGAWSASERFEFNWTIWWQKAGDWTTKTPVSEITYKQTLDMDIDLKEKGALRFWIFLALIKGHLSIRWWEKNENRKVWFFNFVRFYSESNARTMVKWNSIRIDDFRLPGVRFMRNVLFKICTYYALLAALFIFQIVLPYSNESNDFFSNREMRSVAIAKLCYAKWKN